MLTSAGGILALLKDQNQVIKKFSLVMQNYFWPSLTDCAISGGAVEGAADPVRSEEAGPGGRRVLGWNLRLNPDHWGVIIASMFVGVGGQWNQLCPRWFLRMISTQRRSASRLPLSQARFSCRYRILSQIIILIRCTTTLAPMKTLCSMH